MSTFKTIGILSLITLASCSNQKPAKQVLNATEMRVTARIDQGAAFDWNLVPELEPDTLVVQCQKKKPVNVTFESDVDTLNLTVSDFDSALFDILVGDVVAKTEVKCTSPARNYTGEYSADRSTAGDFDADLKPIFEAYIEKKEPGGALNIWDQGELTYSLSSGLDSPNSERSRDASEPFDVASVSKEFTAVVILKLIEEGRLSLDTTVDAFFSNLPNAEKLTIYHLLTHTHGLPSYKDSPGYDASRPLEVSEAILTLSEMTPEFEPGQQYEYGNTSYFLLALLGEKITGEDHSETVRKTIFEPAQMDQSYFLTDSGRSELPVKGYYQVGGVAEAVSTENHSSHMIGYGDIVSTFEDLQKWYRAVSRGEIISKEMFDSATQRKTLNDGSLIERGFSFFSDEYSGEKVIYNSGDHNTHTRYIYFIDQDRFVGLNTHNTIEYHEYIVSEIYFHVVGKMLNLERFTHYDEDIDLSDL